ncbi:hypothetical protein V8G54_003232 [Vigna mungo]|uniref:Uncharacterized protein n=1 Tax=Vigna mungo TaxID=3915 RepID=A0AAQ3PAK9_VIGMU
MHLISSVNLWASTCFCFFREMRKCNSNSDSASYWLRLESNSSQSTTFVPFITSDCRISLIVGRDDGSGCSILRQNAASLGYSDRKAEGRILPRRADIAAVCVLSESK